MNDTEAELQSRAAEYERTQPSEEDVDVDAARRADARQVDSAENVMTRASGATPTRAPTEPSQTKA